MLELGAYNVQVSRPLSQNVYLNPDNNTWAEMGEDNHMDHNEAKPVNLLQLRRLIVGGSEQHWFTVVSMRNEAVELPKGIPSVPW